MIVIQDIDVDNNTTEIKNNSLKSNLILTDREATVPISAIQQLIFRETENCNYPMVCTGILVDNVWYGDRPDEGKFTNPFTGQVITVGNPTPELILQEDWSGLKLILNNWNSELKVQEFGVLNIGGLQPADLIQESDNNYVYQLSSAAITFQDEIELHIRFSDNIHRMAYVNRTNFEDGLSAFALTGTTVEEILSKFQIIGDD